MYAVGGVPVYLLIMATEVSLYVGFPDQRFQVGLLLELPQQVCQVAIDPIYILYSDQRQLLPTAGSLQQAELFDRVLNFLFVEVDVQ